MKATVVPFSCHPIEVCLQIRFLSDVFDHIGIAQGRYILL